MSTKRLSSRHFLVAACVSIVIALVLRVPAFGQIPQGLNRDEAALGYNAYSLLTTGHDEWGQPWPVTFRSFGDEKLPGYIYTLIPFVKLFGLNSWSIKLPSFLAGLAIIVLSGFITRLLSREIKHTWAARMPVVVMLLLAVSPWGNHFSRIAYEAHLALSFFLAGLASFLQARQSGRHWWLVASALGFSAALTTYHSYHAIVPLFLLGLLLLFWKEITRFDRRALGVGISIGLLTGVILLAGGLWKANLTKHAGISPFEQEAIGRRVALLRGATTELGPLNKLISNFPLEKSLQFARNYTETFSPLFYFDTPVTNHVHNVTGIPNLHLLLFPFILIGIPALWHWRKTNLSKILTLWILVALVPSAFTLQPQHTVRASGVFPALEFLAVLGFVFFLDQIAPKLRTLAVSLAAVLLVFSIVRMNIRYLQIAPIIDREHAHDRYHLLAQALHRYETQADAIYTQQPSSSPYIWYLFETAYDAQKLQQTRVSYEPDAEHFVHVKSIGPIHFESIQWPDLEQQARFQRLILIFRPQEIPIEVRASSNYALVEALVDSNQTVQYEVWRMGPELQ